MNGVKLQPTGMTNLEDSQIILRVGKRGWIKVDLKDVLSKSTGLSKTQIKQLFKQKAIDIYVPLAILNK